MLLASAAGVEDVLLPKFIAQVGDGNNQLPASDAWWALRSQRNMAIDEPVSKVMNLGGHNAFNALNEGYDIVRAFAPNQILSMSGQLDVGARLIELDIHDPRELDLSLDRNLILKHGPGPYSFTRLFPYYLDDALAQIRDWLDRPENGNEVIYLDIEDATEQSEAEADDPLIPKLQNHFGSLIYTPAERAADERWPSRAELVARGRRVILFTHRNDDQNGRFGVPQEYVDPGGHVWYGAGIAFRNEGNFVQVRVDEVATAHGENPDFFYATQSDGIVVPLSAPRHEASDVARDARLNVDFIKMDFLFGDDEDADLGSNVLPTFDPFFDLPEGNRVALLEAAVWSWAKNDPAVDRQIFQDLTPGDGTGAALFDFVTTRAGAAGAQNLAAVGATARANGRDVAVQNADGRWESVAPVSTTPMRFAARSVQPNPIGGIEGAYDWVITTGSSTSWFDGYRMVQEEFGSGFVFAAPVNGFQNAALAVGDAAEPVWMNVQDLDRDGNWQVNANRAPAITSVAVRPAAADEGVPVELTVDFVDDLGGHELVIDWGDGSAVSTVSLAPGAAQRFVVSHVYRDDHPAAGTASDTLGISLTLTDAGGLSADAAALVTVNNVAPTVTGFASDATHGSTAAEGEPVHIVAGFTDAGVLDTHVAVVDWGDGSAPQLVTVNQGAGGGTVTGSHAYAAGGVYTITLTVTDDDTGTHTVTTTAVVAGVGLSNGTLYVIGGAGGDHVNVQQNGRGELTVRASFIPDKSRRFDASAVDRIVSYLGDGDDHLTISNQVKATAVIHGGAGDDHLNAGGGPAVLLGDEGDDHLLGQGERNVLVGGVGRDKLIGGRGGDVLIGGRTNADADDSALLGAIAAWNAPAPYADRASTIESLFTVIDDDDDDALTGGSDRDLFYSGPGDALRGVKKDDRVVG